MSYFYVFMTIALTVFGQLAIKWQILKIGAMPPELVGKIIFISKLMVNPWIASALTSAFLASIFWMAAMTKFQLSQAYPFMSLNFVITLLLSGWLLGEPISLQKIAGVFFICVGTVVAVRG